MLMCNLIIKVSGCFEQREPFNKPLRQKRHSVLISNPTDHLIYYIVVYLRIDIVVCGRKLIINFRGADESSVHGIPKENFSTDKYYE